MNQNNDLSGTAGAEDRRDLPCCICRCFKECFSCSNWFGIKEGGRSLDIPSSFCPNSVIHLIAKSLIAAFAVGNYLYHIFTNDYGAAFYFALLTNWAETLTTLYLVISCFNSFLQPTEQPYVKPNLWIRLTWVLAELTLQSQTIVTLIYWTIVFEYCCDTPDYNNVYKHGGLLVLVFIDTMIINRLPVRMIHWYFMTIFYFLYLSWTLIFQFANVKHPGRNNDPPVTLLYSFLDWKNEWKSTAILFILIAFAISPLMYIITYALSLFSCPFNFFGRNRLYISELPLQTHQTYQTDDNNQNKQQQQDENKNEVVEVY